MKATTAAGRRYIKRFVPTMIAYLVSLFGATWALRHYDPQGLALIALSILPALPVIGVIAVMGMYLVEEQDEYLRSRIVWAMLVGLGLMLSVMTAWGFMESAGVLPHLPGYFAFVLWCLGWGLAQCLRALFERKGGEVAE